MQLKDYQNTAIKKLLTRSKELLAQSGGKKVIFKAPTGSGKTIMTAEFLKQLVDDNEIKTPLSFIWTAPRKLHTQSIAFNRNNKYEIIWEEGGFWAKNLSLDENECYEEFSNGPFIKELKVIGNIYENPDLLKKMLIYRYIVI